MNVALFGGTGATGKVVLERLLAQGHAVRALVRPGTSLSVTNPQLTTVEGDALKPEAVREALREQQAAVVVLATRDRTDDHTISEATRCVVEEMQRLRVKRLIAATWGSLAAQPGWITEGILLPLRWTAHYREALEQEGFIQNSPLDWTIVRPFLLTDGPATAAPKAAPILKAPIFGRTATRADLATYLVSQLEAQDRLRQVVVLASRGF